MECPQCLKPLQPIGKFWICPEHGQVATPPTSQAVSASTPVSLAGEIAETPLKVFLSYGHDEFSAEAVRIKADLERRGHTVWFDQQRLRPGSDWEQSIEEGLLRCDKVVLLMTPHSVRRPDGFCLNEIAKALEQRKLIIPVLLVELTGGAPVSISRIQYLDLRDGIPSASHPERYGLGFQRLVRAIEENALEFEGEQTRLLRVLDPLDFRADIAPHLVRFTGREWLFERLNDWLMHQPDSRIFWIVGGPGLGKSAIAAALSHRGDVRGIHFCVHLNADKSDPRRAVLSLAYQLSQQFPEYGRQLSQRRLEAEQGKDAPTLFDNLIVEPLQGSDIPTPSAPQLVVIDALDEATHDGRNELVDFIAQYWSRTPAWLKLVITSRPELAVTSRLYRSDLQPFVLDAKSEANRIDLRRFLINGLQQQGRAATDAVLDVILDCSEGMFLYVATVLDELRHGRLALDRVDDFPRGMAGHYQRFFARQFPRVDDYESRLQPVLSAIVAERAPLPLDVLAAATQLTDGALRQRLATLGSLFPVRPGDLPETADTVSPFHKSIVDWLTGIDEHTRLPLAGPFAIDRAAGEPALAAACWTLFRKVSGAWSPYVLRFTPEHLRLAGQLSEAVAVLSDFNYLGTRVYASQVFDLAGDMVALLQQLPDETLRQRLAPWSHFIRNNASLLGEHPGAFFQQAYNEPVQSPVSLAAQECWQAACHRLKPILPSRLLPQTFLEWINRPENWTPPACLLTLAGHTEWVNSVALSGNGATVASSAYDRTIRIWNSRTGECRTTLQGHSDGVLSVALSTDGMTVFSASADQTVKIWNGQTGECQVTLRGHTQRVTSVAVPAQISVVVSGSADKTVKIWDTRTGMCRRTLVGHQGEITAVAVAANGNTIVSGSSDRTLRVWDTQTGQCRATLEGHTLEITSVAVSSNVTTAVTGSIDKTVKIWDIATGTVRRTLDGHEHRVTCLALSADGATLLTGAYDKTVKVWDVATGVCRVTLTGHVHSLTGLALSADGSTVASSSYDMTVKLWDLDAGNCPAPLSGHTGGVTSIALTDDGLTIVSASADLTAKVWDAQTGTCVTTLVGHTNWLLCVALSRDGGTIVTGAADNTVKVWNAQTGACQATCTGHAREVTRVAVSDDGRTVVSGAYDRTVKVWDAETGVCRATFPTASVEAAAAWPQVALPPVNRVLEQQANVLTVPDSESAASLLAFGSFDVALGPLPDDKILAFNTRGEAFWFQIRRCHPADLRLQIATRDLMENAR